MIQIYFKDKNGRGLGSKVANNYNEIPQKSTFIEIQGYDNKIYKGFIIDKEWYGSSSCLNGGFGNENNNNYETIFSLDVTLNIIK